MKHFLSLIGGAMVGLVLAQGGPALAVDTTTSILCTDPTIPIASRLVAAKEGYPDPGNCYAYPMAGPAVYQAFGPTPAPLVTGPERGDWTDRDLLRHAREDVCNSITRHMSAEAVRAGSQADVRGGW